MRLLGLAVTVDTSVALLELHQRPRNIEVDELVRQEVEIDAFAGDVGGDQQQIGILGEERAQFLGDRGFLVPAAARRQWMVLLLAAGVMFGGTVFGWVTTSIHPSTALSIVPQEFWRQKPAQRVKERFDIQSGKHFQYSVGQNVAFTVMLFTHNILVGVLGFATAAVFGIISIGLLFYNGMMLGSLAQRYFADGVGTYLLAWVGPHGSFELPAICVASAAGLVIARAELTGGGSHGSIIAAIRAQRHDIVSLLLGSAHMFVIAGIFEGGFSQLTNAVIPYWVKISVAVLLFIILNLYLFFIPVDHFDGRPPPLEYFRLQEAGVHGIPAKANVASGRLVSSQRSRTSQTSETLKGGI